MKKLATVALLAATLGALTACGHSDPNYVPPSPKPTIGPNYVVDGGTSIVGIPVNGKLITCIQFRGWQEVSVSCDWDHPGAIPDGQPTTPPPPPAP